MMGSSLAPLGGLALFMLYLFVLSCFVFDGSKLRMSEAIVGYGLGGSSIALFRPCGWWHLHQDSSDW